MMAESGFTGRGAGAFGSGQGRRMGPATERSGWNGAAGLRAERGRGRRKLRVAALVGVLFLYGLVQVRLGSEAAQRSSRVNTLKAELSKTEVDLTVGKSQLASRRILGTLLPAAEQSGFGPGGRHRTIAVDITPEAAPHPLLSQVGQELRAGAEALLPQALAKEVQAAGRPRARRR